MPSGGEYIDVEDPDIIRSKESAQIYETELERMIGQFYNHPSIIVWVPFNEGWGQFDTERITKLIQEKDPSRLVNSASGWADRKVGHINDIHAYPGPNMPEPEPNRAIVLGEFGGLGLPLEGHTWQSSDNWGYRSYSNRQELTDAYTNLLRELQGMIGRGLSAAVYTQTTDVEVEVNGLMTYDRAIIKMAPQTVSKINQGYLPPIFKSEDDIFLQSLKVEMSNELKKGEIYYSVDGSEPGQNSFHYKKPVVLEKTTTLRARTYWDDGTSSAVNKKTYRKVDLIPPVKKVELERGIGYYYYEYDDVKMEKLPDFDRLKPQSSGVTNQINLEKANREGYFLMQFKGFVEIPRDGVYTFFSDSDDGTKLYIHAQLVVNNDYRHGMTEKSGQIALVKGKHPLKLLFFQGEGGKGLRVSYKGPGTVKQVIPASSFSQEKMN